MVWYRYDLPVGKNGMNLLMHTHPHPHPHHTCTHTLPLPYIYRIELIYIKALRCGRWGWGDGMKKVHPSSFYIHSFARVCTFHKFSSFCIDIKL